MAATAAPADFRTELPERLPAGEPYYYLSAKQTGRCSQLRELQPYAPFLPGKLRSTSLSTIVNLVATLLGWVPHRIVASALGYGHQGIDAALRRTNGRPYVWATEFENVHSTWSFCEPSIVIDGVNYHCSEDYYHAQKPRPFDDAVWRRERDSVMRKGLKTKFKDTALQRLLLSTGSHLLLSIKPDCYWGVTNDGQGDNRLAVLLMEIREANL